MPEDNNPQTNLPGKKIFDIGAPTPSPTSRPTIIPNPQPDPMLSSSKPESVEDLSGLAKVDDNTPIQASPQPNIEEQAQTAQQQPENNTVPQPTKPKGKAKLILVIILLLIIITGVSYLYLMKKI